MNHKKSAICAICKKPQAALNIVPATMVRESIAKLILEDHPDWSVNTFICLPDLSLYRQKYVRQLVEAEKGEITVLEQEVLDSLQAHEILSVYVEKESSQGWTFGERLADRLASFGGSWTFLILFGAGALGWIAVNSLVIYFRPVDPYPYILLNLILSCLAAIQAPVIMMSQNRQEAKDRLRSQHDYQINLKAELEIRHLHEKIDHLLSHQWERLIQIQEVQLDLLSELNRLKK